ncbi:MAG: DinB family protein [Planctomycetota bacterium]|nr:DinB family protein [Planctomycetota bacterium]
MTTPTDPAAVLLDFEDWANHRMFDACAGLTDEQLDHEFEMGLGTVRKTLMHDIGAMIGWTSVLEGREPEFSPDFGGDAPSVDRLREMHDQAMARFRAAGSEGYGDVLAPAREGTTYRFSRGGIVVHVTTHSMHHRAQCLNMLRHLGVEEQPPSSVFQWMLAHPPG